MIRLSLAPRPGMLHGMLYPMAYMRLGDWRENRSKECPFQGFLQTSVERPFPSEDISAVVSLFLILLSIMATLLASKRLASKLYRRES